MGCNSSSPIQPIDEIPQPIEDHSISNERDDVHRMYCQLFRELLSQMNDIDRMDAIAHCPDLYIEDSITNNEDSMKLMNYLREKIEDQNPLVSMGRLMLEMGSYDQAEYFYLKTFPIEQNNWIRQAAILNNLGKISHDQEKYSQALDYYEKALKLQREYLPDDHPSLSTDYSNIGTIYQQQNQSELALNYFQRALNIEINGSKPDEELIALFHNNIGLIYNDQEKFSQALLHHQKCLEMNDRLLPSTHPSLALSHHNLSISLFSLDRWDEAFEHIQIAMDIVSHSLPHTHPQRLAHEELFNSMKKRNARSSL